MKFYGIDEIKEFVQTSREFDNKQCDNGNCDYYITISIGNNSIEILRGDNLIENLIKALETTQAEHNKTFDN